MNHNLSVFTANWSFKVFFFTWGCSCWFKEGRTLNLNLKFSFFQILSKSYFYCEHLKPYYFTRHKTVSFHNLWHVWWCLERNSWAVFFYYFIFNAGKLYKSCVESSRREKICKHGSAVLSLAGVCHYWSSSCLSAIFKQLEYYWMTIETESEYSI